VRRLIWAGDSRAAPGAGGPLRLGFVADMDGRDLLELLPARGADLGEPLGPLAPLISASSMACIERYFICASASSELKTMASRSPG